MCGIAAIFDHPDPLPAVRTMLSLLRHRGDLSDPPQLAGTGRSALGAERLCIVDAKHGRQPFTSYDGQWKLVFNGQIYNHAALREELRERGIKFHSRCDTEVLVNLLAAEGPEAIRRLDGMFAFVAVHRDGRRWIAARDPLGIKPLYLATADGATFFASEALPLLRVTDGVPLEVFPPGAWRTESAASHHWDPPSVPPFSGATLEENARALDGLLREAVAKRLPPDLPCAVLFSGGIDSTLIFHLARQVNPQVRGYYVGNPHGKDYAWARRYAEHFGLDVAFVPYTPEEVYGLIPDVVRTLETFEPNQVRNGVFSWLVSRAVARDGYRVALCGEGADELFCGYPELCQPPADLSRAEQEAFILERRRQYLADLHRTQLQRVDRCAMRHSLEVRVPFLDRAILDFALRLPVAQLVDLDAGRKNGNKRIVRELYRFHPEIPAGFAARDKVVFVDGSGMGDNSPAGPLYEHGLEEARARGLGKDPSEVLLKNLEEIFYLDVLQAWHGSIRRMPGLWQRPQVNSRS